MGRKKTDRNSFDTKIGVKTMKNRDFKMRERWERKEYYPDNSGMTRCEKILFRKMNKKCNEEKLKWSKENEHL